MPWLFSYSSSTAIITLGKPQRTVIVVAGALAILATLKIVSSHFLARPSHSISSVHRSNAIRRRQRARTNSINVGNDDSSLHSDDLNPTDQLRYLLPDGSLPENEDITENSASHEEFNRSLSQGFERNGQNIVQLLFRVSEDATRRNSYVHRGCACNGCGMVPIRGIRYRCANCADYDLCENCEAQGVHIKTHIFYKIRVPASAIGPRNMQPVWYLGDPDSVTRQLPRETLVRLSRETGFERPELDAQWEQWTFMANTDWRDDPHDIHLAMDRKTFERCLVPLGGYTHESPCLIHDRMFAFYDTNKDDLIGFSEFLHGIAFRKKKDKWKKIFEGYDIDGDGYVDRKDFLRMFRSYYVLYRAMHTDMLGGMLKQQMSCIDARRLVASRQPLSSAFGQDGRFPHAPDLRNGEGKSVQENGEFEIVDGNGIVSISTRNHGNRHEVLKDDVHDKNWIDGGINSSGYWETILNPPETLEQLQSRRQDISQLTTQSINRSTACSSSPSSTQKSLSPRIERRSTPIFGEDSEDTNSDTESEYWPSSVIPATDKDAEAIQGPGTRITDVRNENKSRVLSHALCRLKAERNAIIQFRAQQDLYARWRRQNSHIEKEKGAEPPAGWKEESDSLVRNDVSRETSEYFIPKNHSRSSSKVHFAENIGEFEAKSRPSSASKPRLNRPARLGIPDDEVDVGKEILFQVTQQAFNELLDPFFKKKEDMAIEAAATKLEREKVRHLYMTSDFEEWAESLEKLKKSAQENAQLVDPIVGKDEPREDDLYEDRLQLDNLLICLPDSTSRHETNVEVTQGNSINNLISDPPSHDTNLNLQIYSQTDPQLSNISYQHDCEEERRPQSASLNSTQSTENLLHSTYHDPSMSQLRANISPETPNISNNHTSPTNSCDNNSFEEEQNLQKKATEHHRPANPTPDSGKQTKIVENEDGKAFKEKGYMNGVQTSQLLRYRLYEKAEKEAETRGGWGRLNITEFEQVVKSEVDKEYGETISRSGNGSSRMDYLGSWIEFCIP